MLNFVTTPCTVKYLISAEFAMGFEQKKFQLSIFNIVVQSNPKESTRNNIERESVPRKTPKFKTIQTTRLCVFQTHCTVLYQL